MWWAWPHLRRLWAAVGTITAGLAVTWVYSLLSERALPHLRDFPVARLLAVGLVLDCSR